MQKTKLETENYLGLYFWLALIAVCLALWLLNPEAFAPERIRQFFSANLFAGLAVYLLLASLRGLTLIPLTPLLLAGILVFPPWPLFWVNLAGIYISSALIYYLSAAFRFDKFFATHYPAQIARLTQLLNKRELPVITLWSFVPFTPTDLIVYVASVLRINVVKTLLGVSVGEAVVCAIYIFAGEAGLSALLS